MNALRLNSLLQIIGASILALLFSFQLSPFEQDFLDQEIVEFADLDEGQEEDSEENEKESEEFRNEDGDKGLALDFARAYQCRHMLCIPVPPYLETRCPPPDLV